MNVSYSPAVVLDTSHEENRFAEKTRANCLNVSTNYMYTLINWICTGLSSSVSFKKVLVKNGECVCVGERLSR